MPASSEKQILLIAHNLRSCHNVGSLLRTAEGLGVSQVVLSGYTPYPLTLSAAGAQSAVHDERLPHLAAKIHKQIAKTALGAETMQSWIRTDDIAGYIAKLQADGWQVAAVEQSEHSVSLPDFTPPAKLALLLGREVEGVEPEILALCDTILEIPMIGQKESFNVVQAAAMALYHCRFARL